MRIENIRLPWFPVWENDQIEEYIKNIFDKTDLNHCKDVLLIVDDHTRPNTSVPRIVLDRLVNIVGEERVAVLVASGLHRASSYQEIENKIGSNAKKVRLYTHNPMTTPSSFLDERYFRIGINTALPHIHTSHTSCGKLICPGIKNYKDIVSFHSIPRSIAEISTHSHRIDFDIGFDVYIDGMNGVVHLEEQDKIRNTFKKEYYTIDMPPLSDVAVLIPEIKWRDFQQSMNCVNLLKYTPVVNPGGIIAFASSTPDGIGVHYLSQQPNGIKPIKYDDVFGAYLNGKTLAFIMENVNYRSIQEYFNQKVFHHSNNDEFYAYVKFIYGDDATINIFHGADMMIGRRNE
jgi:hypothetical protein